MTWPSVLGAVTAGAVKGADVYDGVAGAELAYEENSWKRDGILFDGDCSAAVVLDDLVDGLLCSSTL